MPLPTLLRSVYLRRATGALRLRRGSVEERLYFVAGELYCAPGHPLAERLGGGGEAATEAAVEHLTGWSEGAFELDLEARRVPVDLAGPLPLPELLMELAVRGRSQAELLAELGGERRRWMAPGARKLLAGLREHESEHERFLMRLAEPATVRQLLAGSAEEPREVLRELCRLRAVGLIAPAGEAPDDGADRLLTARLLRNFTERIEGELERRPLSMAAEEQRQRLAGLLEALGEMTHFELLGVEVDARADEIHDAYVALARLVHPRHSRRLGLREPAAALELLFERATLAYLILSDDTRRRRYRRGLESEGAGPPGGERAAEEERVARRNFRLAREHFAREDYFTAIELLWQAVRTDPRPEYYALLGACQSRNPKWRKKAIQSYSLALELDADDHDSRLALAALHAEEGNLTAARRHYAAVLDREPGHRGAKEALGKLRKGSAGGLLRGLGERFKR